MDNRPGAAGAIGVELTATAPPDGYTHLPHLGFAFGQFGDQPETAVRPHQRPAGDFPGDIAVLRDVPAPVRSGKVDRGAHHLRQGQSRQAQLRLIRHRRPAAFRGRDVQPSRRREDGARTLQGRRRGDRRRARRQHPGRVRHPAQLAGSLQGRPAAAALPSPRASALRPRPSIRPSPKRGFPATRSTSGTASSLRRKCRGRSSTSSRWPSRKRVKSPEAAQRFSAEGSTPVGSTPDQFSAHIRSEIAKWRKLVKDAALVLH